MMVIVIALICAIIVGGLIGTVISYDAGYVMVHYGDWVVETSLWVAVLLLLAIYFLIRGIIWLMRALIRSQVGLVRWRSGRKVRTARQQTVRGLLLMAEGRWEEAKKVFLQGVSHVETPLINYLNAARAAHELGNTEERDGYLKRAHETTPGAKFAAMLTQAEFHLKDQRYEQALAALLNLRKSAPQHKSVLLMLAQCYEALGDWQALHDLLKELAAKKAVSDTELKRLSRLVWRSKLSSATEVGSLWRKMPKSIKGDVELMSLWADSLRDQDQHADAEEVLREALEHNWDDALITRYGLIEADAKKRLVVARGWLKNRPSDVTLHVALGRICLAAHQFGEAREYFEAALRLQPSSEIYAELGRLCIALGDERRGADYLLQSVGGLPDLPQPEDPVLGKGVSLGA